MLTTLFTERRKSTMSTKILEKCEKVLEEIQAPDDVAAFVKKIILFECFEKTYQFKKRYREELANVYTK